MGEAWQHVEGGGQYCGVSGYPQRTLNRKLLVDLLPPRDLLVQPLRHQVLNHRQSLVINCITSSGHVYSLTSSDLLGLGVAQVASVDAVQAVPIQEMTRPQTALSVAQLSTVCALRTVLIQGRALVS